MNEILEQRIQGLIEALQEKQLQFQLNWTSSLTNEKRDEEYAIRKYEEQQIEEPWKTQKGSKFIKIICGGSVHAFVEIATGKLVKPAGWSAPATKTNGELQSKYNLLDDDSFEAVKEECDQYGSYLYARK
jgi:hypothetical protein